MYSLRRCGLDSRAQVLMSVCCKRFVKSRKQREIDFTSTTKAAKKRFPASAAPPHFLDEVVARLGLPGAATPNVLVLGIKTQLAQFYCT
jgi:hypothetical protein